MRGGLQTENRLLRGRRPTRCRRRAARADGRAASRRARSRSSRPTPARDLCRLAEDEEVDLLLIDGRRPLLGEGVPRGDVGAVLARRPCDVGGAGRARGRVAVAPGADTPVVVPFGGAEHDWAALELGAWIASATGAPLKLLGAAGETEERSATSSRLLGDAGAARPAVRRRRRGAGGRRARPRGVLEAAARRRPARHRPLGALARGGPRADALGDRQRGARRRSCSSAAASAPGALAPREDVTRFTWSSPNIGTSSRRHRPRRRRDRRHRRDRRARRPRRPRLAERGVAQRLIVRDPGRAPALPGAEVAEAPDYADGGRWPRARGRRDALPRLGRRAPRPRLAAPHAVDAAAAAGVERVVYTSFLGAAPDATFTFGRDHFHTEEHIRAAGLGYTFLRDSMYLDYVPFFASADGVIRGPAGDGASARSRATTSPTPRWRCCSTPQHEGRAYEVTGRQALTLAEAAEILTRLHRAARSSTSRRRSRRRAPHARPAAPPTGRSRAG